VHIPPSPRRHPDRSGQARLPPIVRRRRPHVQRHHGRIDVVIPLGPLVVARALRPVAPTHPSRERRSDRERCRVAGWARHDRVSLVRLRPMARPYMAWPCGADRSSAVCRLRIVRSAREEARRRAMHAAGRHGAGRRKAPEYGTTRARDFAAHHLRYPAR
jgi:hypothetical protein